MALKVSNFSRSEGRLVEQVVDDEHAQINHIVLPPGEGLPRHYSNSNVYLVILRGTVRVTAEEESPVRYPAGSIVAVPYHTKMLIENGGEETLEFFVVKAPHPRNVRGG